MKKKTIYLIISILLVSAFLTLLCALTWGRTFRVAKANRLLAQADDPEGLAAAQRIYEDLLVDQPHSPYLLHNLGLALYRDRQAAAAAGRFQSAGEELAKIIGERRVGPESHRRLEHIFHYHQGSVWFTTAGEAAQEEAIAGYEKALAGFEKAIRANPDDLDAKYNYELTLARLEETRQEQSQQQQKDSGEKDREGQEEKEKGKPGDQENREGEDEESREDPGEQKDGQEQEEEAGSQPAESAAGNQGEEDSGMSKEEARQLLEMAEGGVLYQGPLLPEGPPAGKDW